MASHGPQKNREKIVSYIRLAVKLSASLLVLSATGCTSTAMQNAPAPLPATTDAPQPDTTAPAGAGLNEFFQNYDAAQLSLSPQSKAYRGIRDSDYGQWNDVSDAAAVNREKLQQASAAAMRTAYNPKTMSTEDALSFDLFDADAKQSARLFRFRDHRYIFDQMNGAQSRMPAFLINIHRVSDDSEAQAYISRIEGMGPVIRELGTEAERRASAGMGPPKWVYAHVLSDIDNLIGSDGKVESNAVVVDFDAKVDALTLPEDRKADLKKAARDAWLTSAVPGYRDLRVRMTRMQAQASTDDGVWRMPGGAAYYQALLADYTSTDLSAAQIHKLGLEQVDRIHGEMRKIMAQVGFKGTLGEFFVHLRTDPQYFYKSREAYLADVATKVTAMEAKLPDYFGTLPKAPLKIKAVEAFREKSAGKAFYQSPSPDGSRPGTYYVNLYNLRDMSKTELEALVYHEGVPGHHLQRTIQTEMKDLPPFRRFGGFTAYTEGWGLYAEQLGKDMGFYQDPYSDFGRLGMELWRACRLVVDTGIHDKRWTREQAISYLKTNTPNPEGDIRKAIERYIVYPGQATAYMIGKLKIMELRDRAQRVLGDKFDIRAFHDVVLSGGPVPLDILERRVDDWIAAQQG